MLTSFGEDALPALLLAEVTRQEWVSLLPMFLGKSTVEELHSRNGTLLTWPRRMRCTTEKYQLFSTAYQRTSGEVDR